MRWGPHGLRVFLPQQQWYSREADKFYYWDIFGFLTEEDERDFGEAALRAVRALVRRGEADPEIAALVPPAREESPAPEPDEDEGEPVDVDPDDVPFWSEPAQ